jgi:TPR repeat protein
MMLNAHGDPSAPTEALKLFEEAAEKGHSGAMFALGVLCASGRGLPIGRGAARCWFRAVAEHRHSHAQMMLGRYLISGAAGDLDPVDGRKWLERATAQGIRSRAGRCRSARSGGVVVNLVQTQRPGTIGASSIDWR